MAQAPSEKSVCNGQAQIKDAIIAFNPWFIRATTNNSETTKTFRGVFLNEKHDRKN